MDKDSLKGLILDQNNQKRKENLITRELSSKIRDSIKNPFVIIITGIRISGKSTLLREFITDLDGYYVNFDDERLINFNVADFQQMYELLIELFGEKGIFFFDEIQNIIGWERFVRRLNDSGKKVYITGSNATMLSKELGTHLTGRNIPYTIFPFSFKEFLLFKGYSPDIDKATTEQKSAIKRLFNEYLIKGGFPEYLKTEDENYLKALYDNIIYRDIIARYMLPNDKALKEIVLYSASNVGKEISFNSLKNLANLTSATTVKQYFEYLENCYFAFLVPRYNPSLKKQIYFNKKIYFIDTALVRLLGFRVSEDEGRLLENLVFLQLKRLGKEIYFHRERYECDFIIKEGIRITEVIQVTISLGKNKEREMNGIKEAMNIYKVKKALILTRDEEKTITEGDNKIEIKPVWKWLLE